MTTPAHQRAREIVERWCDSADFALSCLGDDSLDALTTSITAALEDEIEACANVAENQAKASRSMYFTDEPGYKRACKDCANVIKEQRKGAR